MRRNDRAQAPIRSGGLDVVAVDSVAALTPKAEIEGEMGDSHVGLQARLMSQALRKLAGTLNRTDTICLFTNQLREKIGVMFGNPETTPGGRALKFYSSVRLDIRRIETLKEGVEAIGNRARGCFRQPRPPQPSSGTASRRRRRSRKPPRRSSMATVTALRARPNGRVAVDLDGGPWRTLPAEPVVRAGLAVGLELDRERAR